MKMNFLLKGKALLLTTSILSLNSGLFAADPPVPTAVPVVEILATDPTALDGTSSGAFTVLRSASSEADLVVSYVIGGTASNGVDYVLIKDQVTIPAKYLAVDVLIQPIAESINRGNKTVILTLQTNAAYRLQEHKKATVTLVDDVFNNQAPTVALTAPAEGALFMLPCVVTLEATASDGDDSVRRVSFYADDRYLGQATNSPFALSWTNPPAGTYALFARAVDTLGKSSLSGLVHITVSNIPAHRHTTQPSLRGRSSLFQPTSASRPKQRTPTEQWKKFSSTVMGSFWRHWQRAPTPLSGRTWRQANMK